MAGQILSSPIGEATSGHGDWYPVSPDPQAQAAMEQRVRDVLIPAVEAT